MSEGNRRFEHSGLEEGNNRIPVWLLLFYAIVTAGFVIYLIRYLY